MAREINLDGSETTIIKALGLGGAEASGDELMKKIPNMGSVQLSGVLRELIQVGYINADRNSFYAEEEFKQTNFQVNPGYARELREAIDPEDTKPKSRRVRRE